MSEFMYGKEKYIEEGEQIIFENNTDSSFGVETGIVFHKSGLYDVDISNNHVVVSKVDERKTIEETYQKGLKDGKKPEHECKDCRYYGNDYVECPCNYCSHNWESEFEPKADEIKVGDEVEAYSGRAIVFSTSTDKKGDKFCQYWYPNEDRFDKDKTKNLKKTGKHFPQVAELLKVIKSEQRDCHTCKHPDSIECVDCRGFGRWQPKEGVE